jgi:gliding motility-associated-like protein
MMALGVKAQMPSSWTVNPAAYSSSATVTCKIYYQCNNQADPNNAIAAFVNGQCRGVANTNIFVSTTGEYIATLTVYSNNPIGENIQFESYIDGSNAVFTSIDSIVYKADSIYGTISSPYVITDNNNPSDIFLSSQSINENASIGDTLGILTAIDDDVVPVFTYSLPSGMGDNDDYLINGDAVQLNKVLNYALDQNDTIYVEVADAGGCTYMEMFPITITDSTYAPMANIDMINTDEDLSVAFNVLSNDFDLDGDLDSNSITIIQSPSIGILSVGVNGQLDYTPNANISGVDTVIYEVCDFTAPVPLCDTALIVINIAAVDDAPIATADFYNVVEGDTLYTTILINDYDLDNNLDTSSLSIIQGPLNGTAVITAQDEIQYVPNAFYTGFDTLIYEICDLTNPTPLCDTALVVIYVIPVPNAPLAVNDTLMLAEDVLGTVQVLLNDTDADNDLDSSSLQIIAGPYFGTASSDSSGNISYLSDLNYFGSDTLYYQICDSTITGALCDTAMLLIFISPVADAPLAINDTASTPEDTPLNINPLLNDIDPELDIDPTSLSIVTMPTNGIVSISGSQLSYTPNSFYFGTDSLEYAVCDMTNPTALCDTGMIYISITPVSNAPIDIIIDTLFVYEDNNLHQHISFIQAVDNDPNENFFFQLVSGAGDEDNNQFSITDSALFIETKTNFDIKTSYNFRVQVVDSGGLTYEEAFVLEVLDVEGVSIPLPSTDFLSPNNDGRNDYWEIENIDIYENFSLKIFDHHGRVIYEIESGYDNSWDGTYNGEALPTGNYYYVFSNDKLVYKGNITIVNDK